jgi:hypothetical protein
MAPVPGAPPKCVPCLYEPYIIELLLNVTFQLILHEKKTSTNPTLLSVVRRWVTTSLTKEGLQTSWLLARRGFFFDNCLPGIEKTRSARLGTVTDSLTFLV